MPMLKKPRRPLFPALKLPTLKLPRITLPKCLRFPTPSERERIRWQNRRAFRRLVALLVVLFAGATIFIMMCWSTLIVLLVCIGSAWLGAWSRRSNGWEYGTARWAELRDLFERGFLYHRSGMIVGRVQRNFTTDTQALWLGWQALWNGRINPASACRMFQGTWNSSGWTREIITIPDVLHVAVYGPTGAGKSNGHLIPNLRNDPCSAVVTDFKGELLRETGKYRAQRFGHKIATIDPFGLAPSEFQSGSFNPLSVVSLDSPQALAEAMHFARALIKKQPNDHNPFFNNAAEQIVDGILSFLFAHATPADCTLQKLREITTDPEAFNAVVAQMQKSTAHRGHIRRKGLQLAALDGKTRQDVLATLNTHLWFLDSPLVELATSSTSFPIEDLIFDRMTIYILIPPDQADDYAPLLRVWLTAFGHLLFQAGENRNRQVRFYLDEASLLGRDLPVLEKLMTKGRSYGARLTTYWQSPAQVQEVFPDSQANTFRENQSVEQFMGVNSVEAATAISKWIGETTIQVRSRQDTSGMSQQTFGSGEPVTYSSSTSVTTQGTGRALIKPEELLQLGAEATIVLKPQCPPILAQGLRDYRIEDRLAVEYIDDDQRSKALRGARRLMLGPRWKRVVVGMATLCAVVTTGFVLWVSLVCWGSLPSDRRTPKEFMAKMQNAAVMLGAEIRQGVEEFRLPSTIAAPLETEPTTLKATQRPTDSNPLKVDWHEQRWLRQHGFPPPYPQNSSIRRPY